MTQEEKEKAFDEFIEISNNLSRMKSQFAQLQAHVTQFSAFFERLWDAGYKQGEKDTLHKDKVRISKSN